MIQNFTDNKKTNISINTIPEPFKTHIERIEKKLKKMDAKTIKNDKKAKNPKV